MSRFASEEWVLWLGSIGLMLLLASMIFLAWWGLFADTSRGRRRCPRCWYDMAYSPSWTCPECGYSARSEKDLSRTRRRPRIAILGMVGAALIGGFVIDRANQQVWMSHVPTTVLLWLLPAADNPAGSIFTELERRMAWDMLSNEQWLTVFERAAQGDSDARPPGDEWRAKYGRLLQLWSPQLLSHDDEEFRTQIERLLLSIPPHVVLSTRQTWPEDAAPRIAVEVGNWWPAFAQMRIIATPNLTDAAPDVHLRYDPPIQRLSYSFHLPQLETGEHNVEIRLQCQRRLFDNEPWLTVWEESVSLPVRIEGALSDALTPVNSDELDEAIRSTFRRNLYQHQSGSLPVRVGLDPRFTYVELFDDTAVAVRIDVLRNGELARRLDIWWRGGAGNINRQHAWTVPMHDDEVLGPPSTENDRWTLHVYGLPEFAMNVEGVSKYWAGDVTVVVPVQSVDGEAPPRGWIPETDTDAHHLPAADGV